MPVLHVFIVAINYRIYIIIYVYIINMIYVSYKYYIY